MAEIEFDQLMWNVLNQPLYVYMQWQQHAQPHKTLNTIQHFSVPNLMSSLGHKPFGEGEFYSPANAGG